MLSSHEASFSSRFLRSVAGAALAVAVSAGLAGCGGGGGSASGGGGQVTIMPEPSPDLVVDSLALSDAAPEAGAGFTLSVRVRNAGDEAAAATTVRFYRSADNTISTSDTEVGSRQAVAELAASGVDARRRT